MAVTSDALGNFQDVFTLRLNVTGGAAPSNESDALGEWQDVFGVTLTVQDSGAGGSGGGGEPNPADVVAPGRFTVAGPSVSYTGFGPRP